MIHLESRYSIAEESVSAVYSINSCPRQKGYFMTKLEPTDELLCEVSWSSDDVHIGRRNDFPAANQMT